jgi:hypothetical protein
MMYQTAAPLQTIAGPVPEASPPATLATDPLIRWEVVDRLDAPPVIRAGRITLGPGASLTLGQVPAPVLLAVEAGTLLLTAELGEAWVSRDGEERSGLDGDGVAEIALPQPEVIAPGNTVSLDVGGFGGFSPGATATFQNAGEVPVVVLVVACDDARASG